MSLRLASNTQLFCHSLPSAGITGVCVCVCHGGGPEPSSLPFLLPRILEEVGMILVKHAMVLNQSQSCFLDEDETSGMFCVGHAHGAHSHRCQVPRDSLLWLVEKPKEDYLIVFFSV